MCVRARAHAFSRHGSLHTQMCVHVCQGVDVSAFVDVQAGAQACARVQWIQKYTMPISDMHDRSSIS